VNPAKRFQKNFLCGIGRVRGITEHAVKQAVYLAVIVLTSQSKASSEPLCNSAINSDSFRPQGSTRARSDTLAAFLALISRVLQAMRPYRGDVRLVLWLDTGLQN